MTPRHAHASMHMDESCRETELSKTAVAVFGPDFVEQLHTSSRDILRVKADPAELRNVARTIREDLGGLVRGEMRLARRGAMFRDHTDSDEFPLAGELIRKLPQQTSKFLLDSYPQALGTASLRLVQLIAGSYALDRAVMDFWPQEPTKSCAASLAPEIAKKMVLVVGATAVGKDTVRAGIVKDLHPSLRLDQSVSQDELIEKASEIGIVMPVKMTGRGARPGERDYADYVFFDGKDGRPPEAKLTSLSRSSKALPYSYSYAGHTYGFAWKNIPTGMSGKDRDISGLKEKLESDSTRMILCGGGTTPEAVYFKQMFPQATVLYLLATGDTSPQEGLLAMEREVVSRWWGRNTGQLLTPVRAAIGKLTYAAEETLRGANLELLTHTAVSPEVQNLPNLIPTDTTAYAADVEEKARRRLVEVMPQVGQALMLGPQMGFTIVPNKRGRLEIAISQIRNVLRKRGVIEEDI